jgi:hypothetical protein
MCISVHEMFQDRVRNMCLRVTQSSMAGAAARFDSGAGHTGVRATGDRTGSSRLAAEITDVVREARHSPNPNISSMSVGVRMTRCDGRVDPNCCRRRRLALGWKLKVAYLGHMTWSLHHQTRNLGVRPPRDKLIATPVARHQ